MESPFVPNQTSIRSAGEIVAASVLPLLKLICLTAIGSGIAHPRIQLVPRATFNLLSRLVFTLFLPCMIFIHLGEIITLKNFVMWWFIPVSVVLSTAIGCVLGLFVAKICCPPSEYFKFTVIMTAFGNTGNLPLAIVGSVCRSIDNPFGSNCRKTGIAYVSFAQWFALVIVYSFVYHMMEPPKEYCDAVENGIELQEQDESSDLKPFLGKAERLGNQNEGYSSFETPLIAQVLAHSLSVSRDSDSLEGGGSGNGPGSLMCLVEPGMEMGMRNDYMKMPIWRILQPPALATLLAFIVGMVPQIKSVVFGDDAPFSFITESLEILDRAVVPSVMLILGGVLVECPNESKLGVQTTVGIIIARLLVLPLIGVGVVSLADRMKLLIPGDRMYRFVLLLQFATPSAILLGAIANLRGYAVSEASAVLFWQHVCAVFSLAIYNMVYFKWLISSV